MIKAVPFQSRPQNRNNAALTPISSRVQVASDVEGGYATAKVGEMKPSNTIAIQGQGSTSVSGQFERTRGSEDFGTTSLNVAATAQNGPAALGQGMEANPRPEIALAGRAIEAVSPAGTIDFNLTFRITGSGTVNLVRPDSESKNYPSYAAYSYTIGADGNTVTNEIFTRRENKIEDLTKPMTPIP
jgi:hypothetical protein